MKEGCNGGGEGMVGGVDKCFFICFGLIKIKKREMCFWELFGVLGWVFGCVDFIIVFRF